MTDRRFDMTERLRYLRQFGNQALSYTTLQPEMEYFDLEGVGYIAYQVRFGRRFVLGDPVCAPKDLPLLIQKFLAEDERSIFLPVQLSVARVLHETFGFFATQVGCETSLDLTRWSPCGRRMRNFRRAASHAQRHGVVVAEEPSVNADEISRVSLKWRHGRTLKNRWLKFVSRPIEIEPGDGVRKFLARSNGQLVGYVFFDPIFEDNQVVAYGPSLSAFTPEFRKGLFYLIIEQAAQKFRKEGIARINLGLSPLDIIAPTQPFESRLFRCGLAALRIIGNRIYNFSGLSFIKHKFYGEQTPVFVAHRKSLPAIELFGFLRLSAII
jgi:phosphatidylglycerol lysyltransferase